MCLGCIGDECTDEYLELTSMVEDEDKAGYRALGASIYTVMPLKDWRCLRLKFLIYI